MLKSSRPPITDWTDLSLNLQPGKKLSQADFVNALRTAILTSSLEKSSIKNWKLSAYSYRRGLEVHGFFQRSSWEGGPKDSWVRTIGFSHSIDRRFTTTLYIGRYYTNEPSSWIVQRSCPIPIPIKELSQSLLIPFEVTDLLASETVTEINKEAFHLGNAIIPRREYEKTLLDLAKREIIPGSRAIQVLRDLEEFTSSTYLDVLRAVSRRLSVGCVPTQMKTLCRLYESCLTLLPIH